MKQVQRGFTLIELVMVIVILGILAAVAIPKFIDLKGDARLASIQGVAGALSSASTINYAARSANITKGVPVTICSSVVNAMEGGIPADYTASATAVPAGTSLATCSISTTSTPVLTQNFTAIGIL